MEMSLNELENNPTWFENNLTWLENNLTLGLIFKFIYNLNISKWPRDFRKCFSQIGPPRKTGTLTQM